MWRFEQELHFACTAVQLCSRLTRNLQRKSLELNGTAHKSDYSPVTVGDYAVQTLLTYSLSTAFEKDHFVAEENAPKDESLTAQVWRLVESARSSFEDASLQVPHSVDEMLHSIDLGGKNERTDWRRTWVIDPIDGTSTFLKGQQYAINCALLVDGVEHIAIIGCPNLPSDAAAMHEDLTDDCGVLLFAIRGGGLWIRPLQDDGTLAEPKRVQRGERSSLDQLVWSDCSSRTSTIAQLHRDIAKSMGCSWPGVDLYSSLMNYAALGLGYADIVIRIFKRAHWTSNVWDHAGGVLVYEEAGGKVTDLNGNSIDFSAGRKMSHNFGLVCAPANLHAEVLDVIQKALQVYGPIP